MADLNIVSYVILSVLAVVVVQIHSVPVQSNWLVDATNSIEESMIKIESSRNYKNNEKIMMIADESFNSFTNFAEDSLSEMIEQVDGMKSEEAYVLESKLMKWLKDLRILKYEESYVNEKKNENILEKFLLTMDYVSNEVVGFYNNYNTESSEVKQIIGKMKSSTKKTVAKLAECAKSVEDQVSEMYDNSTDYEI